MNKEYDATIAFISKQDKEWEEHRRQIGFFGRFFENLFGSSFAHKQYIEFKEFCMTISYE